MAEAQRTSTRSRSGRTGRTAATGGRLRWSKRRLQSSTRNSACSTHRRSSSTLPSAAPGAISPMLSCSSKAISIRPKCCDVSRPWSGSSAGGPASAGGRASSTSTSSCGAAGRSGRGRLTIPHPASKTRSFVLQPLAAIAPEWRVRGALTARHLAHRLARRARARLTAARSGPIAQSVEQLTFNQ